MTSSSVKAERRPWWLLLTWGLWMMPAGIALAENSLPEVRTYPASRIGPDTATLQCRVKQFEYLDGPRPRRTGDREFRGGVLVDDGQIVLVPRTGRFVGQYDPSTGTVSHTAEHGQPGGFGMGSVIDGYTVIMTPRGSRNVGIYDALTGTYRDGAAHGRPSNNAFLGSAKVASNLIVFGPLHAKVVGLYDPQTDAYTDGPEHHESGRYRFSVITLSTKTGKVIFTPFDSEHVGIYDPTENSYTSGAAHHAQTRSAYSGSVEVTDGRIVMAPRNAAHVGIYDPATDSFTKGPKHGEGAGAFMAAALMPGGEVVMAPYRSDHVGIYDPDTGQYRSGPSVAQVDGVERGRFSGAILTKAEDKLVMTNRGADVIGIVRENRFFVEVGPANVFFRYRRANESQWQETEKTTVSSPAAVSQQITGLRPATPYEYRAVIQHDDKTMTGKLKTFTTSRR